MNKYKDYLAEIEERKIQGLSAKPIDDGELLAEIISQIKIDIPTYTEKNLPKELSSLKPIKPGSRNL